MLSLHLNHRDLFLITGKKHVSFYLKMIQFIKKIIYFIILRFKSLIHILCIFSEEYVFFINDDILKLSKKLEKLEHKALKIFLT